MATVLVAEEGVVDEEEAWEEKESSCPVSEERREQERRSTVCREEQRRSSGRHPSVTFVQPATQRRREEDRGTAHANRTWSATSPARFRCVRLSLRGEMGEVRVCTVWSVTLTH